MWQLRILRNLSTTFSNYYTLSVFSFPWYVHPYKRKTNITTWFVPCYIITWKSYLQKKKKNPPRGHVVTGSWITTLVQKELRSFSLIANYCFKIWVLGINVLCIIVQSDTRDLFTMQGREGQDGNSCRRGKVSRVPPCRQTQNGCSMSRNKK